MVFDQQKSEDENRAVLRGNPSFSTPGAWHSSSSPDTVMDPWIASCMCGNHLTGDKSSAHSPAYPSQQLLSLCLLEESEYYHHPGAA